MKHLPTLFFGHGSPMNVLNNNKFTHEFKKAGESLGKPKAILCVSAHWVTPQTFIQASSRQKQIFDFYGFPEELYKLNYSPPGSPELVNKIVNLNANIISTLEWGLDHGAWSILYHMYPNADVPVLQLSINKNYSYHEHLKLALSLMPLREENILIMTSGNIVHNLKLISWDEDASAHVWAKEFESDVINIVSNPKLAKNEMIEKIFRLKNTDLAHPTQEHLIPIIYNIGVLRPNEILKPLILGVQNSSISMASFGSV